MRDTSIEAYRIVLQSGLVAEREREIYDILFHKGPLTQTETGLEIVKKFGLRGKADIKQSTSNLFSKMRNKGILCELPVRRPCSHTGISCIQWDVTSKYPHKPEKPMPEKQRLLDEISQLKQENQELKKQLRIYAPIPRTLQSGSQAELNL